MHNFDELIYRGTSFTLSSLEQFNEEMLKTLDVIAPTPSIKNLQMIQLQKVIIAIGMFSLFDAILQDGLNCRNGFQKIKETLIKLNLQELRDRFLLFEAAINVLKHGKGRSYDYLILKCDQLPFKIKKPNEAFFNEGDVSEVDTLIEVDNQFVLNCANIIENISEKMREVYPDYYK